MRGCIALLPARLAVTRHISSGGEGTLFSCDALTGPTGAAFLGLQGEACLLTLR